MELTDREIAWSIVFTAVVCAGIGFWGGYLAGKAEFASQLMQPPTGEPRE